MFSLFFSSRRRHTRCSRDWSSDVCSSDLDHRPRHPRALLAAAREGVHPPGRGRRRRPARPSRVLGGRVATETAVDVVMPQMGVSVSEGTITKWLKSEGEQVEADESLLEISTDKVDTEVPSPASGTLTQILVQEGETVEVGTKLAQIGGAPAGNGQASAAPPEPATAQAAAEAEAVSSSEGETPTAAQVEETKPEEPAPE